MTNQNLEEAETWAPAKQEPIRPLYADAVPLMNRRDVELAHAQVHATLYLAEQQRIANLIAMLATDIPRGEGRQAIVEELVREMRL
jgi:hypothetical protein